ncbi:MAG: hypothetical protein ABR920_13825 [Terriglobales bacterium]
MVSMKRHPPLSQKQYAELGYAKLHAELKRMLSQAERITTMFNAGSRLRLLPALYAMRELVAAPGQRSDIEPDRPSWERECRLLGITAEQVRQWKHRTAAETDIRHLVGEERARNAAPSTSNARALEHLARLATAVLNGDEIEAEKLAAAYAEIYGF